MGVWVHRLIEKDVKTQIGVCISCGTVKIKLKIKKGRMCCICWTAYAEDKRNSWRNQFRRGRKSLNEKYPDGNTICEICSVIKPLVWDHCHKSGKFRGWICQPCNKMLGFALDNIDTLQKAIIYLKKKR